MKTIKYYFLCVCLAGFFGCSGRTYLTKQVSYYGYDFTDYTKKGFLFTPEKYTGEYESIGLLNVEMIPEAKKLPQQHYGATTDQWQIIDPATGQEVLEELYKMATRMGADAVINLNIEPFLFSVGYDTYVTRRRAYGFAIKRKGALK